MSIFDKIKEKRLHARKTHDVTNTSLLTTLMGEIDRVYPHGSATDEDIIKIIIKMRKSIDETQQHYETHGIPSGSLAMERDTLERFLPRQMVESEMRDWIEFNLNPDSSIREAMVGINKYAKENGLMVDKGAFAKLVNNR